MAPIAMTRAALGITAKTLRCLLYRTCSGDGYSCGTLTFILAPRRLCAWVNL